MVFLYFVLYINVCSKSHEWEVLAHGSLYKKVTIWTSDCQSPISRKRWWRLVFEVRLTHAPLATMLLVTETYDIGIWLLAQAVWHTLDMTRLWWLAQGYGPQLSHGSWMYVFLFCPACGRLMGSTYMRLLPQSEPAFHNRILRQTEPLPYFKRGKQHCCLPLFQLCTGWIPSLGQWWSSTRGQIQLEYPFSKMLETRSVWGFRFWSIFGSGIFNLYQQILTLVAYQIYLWKLQYRFIWGV